MIDLSLHHGDVLLLLLLQILFRLLLLLSGSWRFREQGRIQVFQSFAFGGQETLCSFFQRSEKEDPFRTKLLDQSRG